MVNALEPGQVHGASAGPWVDRDTAVKVLTEMTSNAAKHALPHSTVYLGCHVQDDDLVITMTNPVHSRDGALRDDVLSSGMGLDSMRTRAAKAGGTVEAGVATPSERTGSVTPEDAATVGGSDALFWRTTLRLPIVVIKS